MKWRDTHSDYVSRIIPVHFGKKCWIVIQTMQFSRNMSNRVVIDFETFGHDNLEQDEKTESVVERRELHSVKTKLADGQKVYRSLSFELYSLVSCECKAETVGRMIRLGTFIFMFLVLGFTAIMDELLNWSRWSAKKIHSWCRWL